MDTVKVDLKENSYDIVSGQKILWQVGKLSASLSLGTDAIVITNPGINKLYGKLVIEALKESNFSPFVLEVPAGEKSKSTQTAFRLLETIAKADVGKKVFIVALGGGVIGDLAGFIAAIYKRGIPYVQIPTTFLAQIDSAIGGKVAIDLPVGKNLVGSFHQPRLVLSDVTALSSLDKRQIKNGLAEAIKYGIICDRNLFDYIREKKDLLLSMDLNALSYVVYNCSQIKARIVSSDEKETKGIRTILNFGHTVGHAIEAAGGFNQYHHGEAIALGMRVASEMSLRQGLLEDKSLELIEQVITAAGLPTQIKGLKLPQILKAMGHDKKFLGKKNRFVLATKIGSVKIVEDVPQAIIEQSIQKYLA